MDCTLLQVRDERAHLWSWSGEAHEPVDVVESAAIQHIAVPTEPVLRCQRCLHLQYTGSSTGSISHIHAS